jgi:hypothetical protein
VAEEMNTVEQVKLVKQIWPVIEEANRLAPAHARVEDAMILPSNPQKPFLRAGKGTVQRAGTLLLYKDEIDRLYRNAELGDVEDEPVPGKSAFLDIIRTVLASRGLQPANEDPTSSIWAWTRWPRWESFVGSGSVYALPVYQWPPST